MNSLKVYFVSLEGKQIDVIACWLDGTLFLKSEQILKIPIDIFSKISFALAFNHPVILIPSN